MKIEWQTIFDLMRKSLNNGDLLPAISTLAQETSDPFQVLISTLISLRTKDKVTIEASRRLFERAPTPQAMLLLSKEEIEELIYPAGFYRVKANNILKISQILMEEYGGEVPSQKALLMALPGVGTKTANLTLNLGFNIEAICVDIHVHRISNRMGWISDQES
ncbi:MAG: endonuclease III domain-containing protein [Sphaerochaetaceae bacterium]